MLFVVVIGIVGLTVAYFSNSTSIENKFETAEYGTDVVEIFTSPTGWQPGDETPKVLIVKNTGEVDEAVRVKVEEKWVSKNGDALPLKQGNNVAAQINYINSSDWTRVDVDGEDYYYYYYNYKLVPGEETSRLLDKVTFNPLISASLSCQDNNQNGEIKKECYSSGDGYDGATYTLKFTIETVQYNKYASAWNTNLEIAGIRPMTTSDLAAKANASTISNYNDGNVHEMYTFSHGVTKQTAALTDYRYIGNDPYNYVYFNCDNLNNPTKDTCEVWRIIGVFSVDDGNGNYESRIKLVRGNALESSMKWDDDSDGLLSNNWKVSKIEQFLNGDYYNRANNALNYGLKNSTYTLIADAKYYLGAPSLGETGHFGNVEAIYEWERGDTLCGSCGSDSNNLYWTGKVGLMYPSDEFMTYTNGVDLNCYNDPALCSETSNPVGNPKQSWIYNTNTSENNPNYTWLISGLLRN